ncbi:MAG: hypothetical protein M1840_008317 [Geoglossum simile]|nr:MAG: hypothetical protein M1840_008317 [Geoglossum simile]
MINLSPSTLATWACLLMLTTASALLAEKDGKYTIYKRQSSSVDPLVERADPFTWPFPANKSSIVDQASEPKDNPPQDLQVTVKPVSTTGQIPRKFIEEKCDNDKKSKITEAWKEAKLLADAQTILHAGYRYDIPHTQWLGKDWNSESSWIPWRWNFRQLIQDNFSRLRKLYSNDAPAHEFIYWYCYDYGNQCSEGVQAYSWDHSGWIWSNHYIVFCNPFYNRQTLGEQVNKHAGDQRQQKIMENFHISRGGIMFHETWHFKDLVSSPRTSDYAYQAQPTWDLAKNKGTNWAYVNADSYALDAVAIYVQQHYKSSMSPVPWRELAKLDPEAAAGTSEPPADNARAISLAGPPSGWTGPLPNTDNPNPAEWREVKDGDGWDSSEMCKLAVKEIWTCEPVESNLYASVKITGADGKEIYTTPQSTHSPGQPINSAKPLSLQENGMKNALVITGQHTNDYIQFAYGSTSWTTMTKEAATDGKGSCKLKGNDWNKGGPSGCPAGPAIVGVLEISQMQYELC